MLLGLLGLAGLVVLAVAGVTGATAILVTGAAVLAMIGLGNAVGGRHTPARAPYDPSATGAPDAGADATDTGGPDARSSDAARPAGTAGDGGDEASPGPRGPEGTLER